MCVRPLSVACVIVCLPTSLLGEVYAAGSAELGVHAGLEGPGTATKYCLLVVFVVILLLLLVAVT